MQIEIKTTLRREEFAKFSLKYIYGKLAFRVVSGIILFLVLVSVLNALIQQRYDDLGIPAIMFLSFFMVFPLFVYRGAKKAYDNAPDMKNQFVYTFNEEGITVQGHTGSSTIMWQGISKVQETKDFMVFFQNTNNAYNLVPRRDFGNNLDTLKSFLKQQEGLKLKLR